MQAEQDHEIPQNDRCVEDVDHPQEAFHAHRDGNRDKFAHDQTSHPSQARGKVRNQRVGFERAVMKRDQCAQQVEHLEQDEGPTGVRDALEPRIPSARDFRDGPLGCDR